MTSQSVEYRQRGTLESTALVRTLLLSGSLLLIEGNQDELLIAQIRGTLTSRQATESERI